MIGKIKQLSKKDKKNKIPKILTKPITLSQFKKRNQDLSIVYQLPNQEKTILIVKGNLAKELHIGESKSFGSNEPEMVLKISAFEEDGNYNEIKTIEIPLEYVFEFHYREGE